MRTMHQASILMTFFVGLMGVVWYALETGVFDQQIGEAAQVVIAGAGDAPDQPAVRFAAKVHIEAITD